MRKLINMDQVCSVKPLPKQVNNNYVYLSEISFLGFVFRKAGIYTHFLRDKRLMSIEELSNENCYLDDGVVYFQPCAVFNTTDGKSITRFFETEKEMTEYLDFVTKFGRFV